MVVKKVLGPEKISGPVRKQAAKLALAAQVALQMAEFGEARKLWRTPKHFWIQRTVSTVSNVSNLSGESKTC